MRTPFAIRLALLTAVVGVVSGCPPQTTCDASDLVVSFVDIQDGAMLTRTENVRVTLQRKSGVAVPVSSAKLAVRPSAAGEFGAESDGTISEAQAVFSSVSLPVGAEVALRVTLGEKDATCTASSTIVVTVKDNVAPPPVVTACSFPQDTNQDGKLSSQELAGSSSVNLRVQTMNGAGATASAPGATTAPIMNDSATLSVPVPAQDGPFVVSAVVTRGAAMVNCPSTPTIEVRRTGACSVEQNTLVGPLGPQADADTVAIGYQVRASAKRLSGTVMSASFRMGTQTRAATFVGDDASADFTVASSGTQTYDISLTASDDLGNACTVVGGSRMVTVDFDAPLVSITSPTLSMDGGRPLATRSPVSVSLSVGPGNEGATACAFRVVGPTRTQVDCGPIAGGVATLLVPVSADGQYRIDVDVTDAAGNVGTASREIEVVLSGCGIGFTRPSACPSLVTNAQVSAGNYLFQTQSRASCSGQPVRLGRATVVDGGIGAFTNVTQGTVSGTGQAQLATTVTSGSYVFRADVQNLGDGGFDAVDCEVTVDLDGPAITTPSLSGGQTRLTINATQDNNQMAAGAQSTLAFSARVPVGGRVDVCTTQGVDPVSMQTRQTSAACGTGWFVLATQVVSPISGFTFPEGTYSIKVAVSGGGTSVESPALPLFVDVRRPCVSQSSLRFPQDTNADGRLNVSELAMAAPVIEFQLDPACGDTDLTTLLTANPIAVREVVSGTPGTALNTAADVSFSAGRVRVTLSLATATERDFALFVEMTDAAINRNLYSGPTDRAAAAVRVDRVVPSCVIVSPSRTSLNISDVTGGSLPVTIASSADVGMNGITSTLAGAATQTQMGTPSGASNQATLTFSGITGTGNWNLSATCRDTAGNLATATPLTLSIDLDRPTCSITAPTAMTYSTLAIPTSVTVGGAEGRLVAISSTLGGARGSLPVSSGTASGTITYANGTQTITATVSDAAGNDCTATIAGVVVNSTDCGLSVTNAVGNSNGLWFNTSNTTAGTATITAQTSACSTGRVITLQRTAPTAGTPITATDVAGTATFPNVALADGEVWSVSVPNMTSPTTQTFRVDLDAPTFGLAPNAGQPRINSVSLASTTPLFFVAAQDNRNVETAVAGYFADTAAATNGAQLDLVLDAVSAFDFGLNGQVTILFKGTTVATQSVAMASATVSFTGPAALTLPQNDTGAFTVRVTDAAGNSAEWSTNATIDVLAPAAPPNQMITVTNARRGEVTAAWDPSFDDGTGTAPCEYEFAWTTGSVVGNGSMATSALYFAGTSMREARVPHSASRISRPFTLPPLNTYFVKLRAVDEVGNYSAFGAGPSTIPNLWTTVTLSNPSTDTTAAQHNFGQNVTGGASLNNDALPDLVVAAPNRGPTGATNRGSVFIYYGSATFPSSSTCVAPACQELQPPTDPTASGLFGTDISIAGNVGDVAAEGKADLMVGQPTWQTNVGRAFLYFGANAQQLNATSFVEFRGTAGSAFASTARIVKDIDGDGLDEVAISAHTDNGNVGRIFVFRGRSADPSFMAATPGSNWFNSRTATDGTNSFIPTTGATWVLEGPALIPAGANDFGRFRNGLFSLGTLDPSTTNNANRKNYLVVPMSREQANRAYVYSGPALSGLSGSVPNNSPALIQTLQVAAGTSTQLSGFSRAGAALDLVPGTGADLVLTYPILGRVYVFENLGATGVAGGATPPIPTPAITGSPTHSFGNHLSAGDVNDDGFGDLLIGEARATGGRAFMAFYRSGTYDSPLDGAAVRFWNSILSDATSTSRLGRVTGVADVNGDGQRDVILGDETTGVVRVWR